jgi:hypothetical protein
VKERQKEFNKSEKEASEKMRVYLPASKGKDSSEIQRVKALIGIESLYESGDRRTSDLILLNDLHVLAEYVYEHELLIDKLDIELEESGIRKLIKNTEAINDLVERIRQLKEQNVNTVAEAENREKELKKLFYVR